MAKSGRPAFPVTPALRREVEQMRSVGMSIDEIAIAIGCSTPTLTKHFDAELTTGAAKRRREVVNLLYQTARKGNVSAQKKLEEMTQAAALAAARMDEEPAPDATQKPSRLGKKEQAAADAAAIAEEPGNKFAPPPPPKLVVNNG